MQAHCTLIAMFHLQCPHYAHPRDERQKPTLHKQAGREVTFAVLAV